MQKQKDDFTIVREIQAKKRKTMAEALDLMDTGVLFISEPTRSQNRQLLSMGRVDESRRKWHEIVTAYKEKYNARAYVDKRSGKTRFIEVDF